MKYLFLLILSLQINICFSQRELTSSVPKAVRSFQSATKYYDERNNDKAIESLNDAIEADPHFIEAFMLRANIYSDLQKYPEAISSYKSAIEINANFFPNNFYSLAKVEYLSGKYDDAKTHLQQFIDNPKVKGNLLYKAKQMLVNAEFAQNAVNNPVDFKPVNMGDSINSADQEYFPAITADGKTFLFTRRLKTQTPDGNTSEQEDFYISKYTTQWSKAQPLKSINTDGNEGAPALSPDGQYLFFTACEEMSANINARKTNGRCDLFIAKKIGNDFKNPRNLEAPISTGSWESQPSFSSDGRTLYFIRAIKGSDGISQMDIMVSHIGDNSQWSEPVSVSDLINTSGNEQSVFIHPDDKTLYFSSDGHPGMGGLDIFVSRRDSAGNWTKPVNLGYPINTVNDENSFLVSPDGKMAFIASDREGTRGGLDLYQFPLYEKARPQPVTYMKGKVFDEITKEPLSASFELIDLGKGKVVVSSSSNPGNGEFLVALPTGKSYALNVSKDGYLFYSENFQLKDQSSEKETYNKDVPMKPVKTGESIVLKNIFFDFNKFQLQDESSVELGRLITFLNKNPKITFEIGGHTDNVGGKEYNQQLSEKRAQAVYDYLSSNGIAKNRMTAKGYGDTKPVAKNTTEQLRAQNRRTEFVVTSGN